MRELILIGLALMLSACGFHLRGQEALPFDTLMISPGDSALAGALKQAVEVGSKTRIVGKASKSTYRLQILDEYSDRVILSLDAAGQVREYQLRYRVAFRLLDARGHAVIPRSELSLSRIMSYDNTQILAKANEASLLYQNMQSDAVDQIMRRLNAVRPDEN